MVLNRWEHLKLNQKFTVSMVAIVIVPILILDIWLLTAQRKTLIDQNTHFLRESMERQVSEIETHVGSINMATQFFMNDDTLTTILEDAYHSARVDTEDLLDFYNHDVASLERMVNNNPLLYAVRAYSVTDEVQEMMPILFGRSRMYQQEWSGADDLEGWHYQYQDHLFVAKSNSSDDHLVAYITEIQDYAGDTIGVIEAAMTMETMFPSLYSGSDTENSYFLSAEGILYSGENLPIDEQRWIRSEAFRMGEDHDIHVWQEGRDGKNYLIAGIYLSDGTGTLLTIQDMTDKFQEIYRRGLIYSGIMILLAIVLGFVIHWIVKLQLKKFYEILAFIQEVQDGDLQKRLEMVSEDEMGIMGSQINEMLDRIQYLTQDNLNRALLVKNSEIRALQNQINTHFIYNVLESVKMMAEIDEEYAISDAITSLGKMLRYSMKWVSGNILVEKELEYIEDYISLMNLRFDYEIRLDIMLTDEIKRQRIPKMTLQPIVENAILHGIEEMAEDTAIHISGEIEGNNCKIMITDFGRGMTGEELEFCRKKISGDIDAGELKSKTGNGIGLKNVQDRIHIAFGDEYGLQFDSKYGSYTCVSVTIPYEKQTSGGEST